MPSFCNSQGITGLEGRHTKVLETEFKNRRRLNNLNYREEVKLQQRMRTLQSDLQAEVSRQHRAMTLVNRRLLDIKAYQDVLRDRYAFTESVYAHMYPNDYQLKSSFQTLKREINQKRKELDPVYQHREMRYKRIDQMKQQNRVVPFDRNISSLTTILQTYSKARKPSVLRPKGVIVTVNGAKRSQSFSEPAAGDTAKEVPPTFRSQ